VAQLCNRIAVMYAGNVVEAGPVRRILRNPQHPYTRGLLAAIPTDDTPRGALQGVAGSVPNLYDPPPGCRFAPRCAFAHDACTAAFPATVTSAPDHQVACVLYQEGAKTGVCS
jgi:oligopeptide/dipeptide ABC transporter ATP-binding protein